MRQMHVLMYSTPICERSSGRRMASERFAQRNSDSSKAIQQHQHHSAIRHDCLPCCSARFVLQAAPFSRRFPHGFRLSYLPSLRENLVCLVMLAALLLGDLVAVIKGCN